MDHFDKTYDFLRSVIGGWSADGVLILLGALIAVVILLSAILLLLVKKHRLRVRSTPENETDMEKHLSNGDDSITRKNGRTVKRSADFKPTEVTEVEIDAANGFREDEMGELDDLNEPIGETIGTDHPPLDAATIPSEKDGSTEPVDETPSPLPAPLSDSGKHAIGLRYRIIDQESIDSFVRNQLRKQVENLTIPTADVGKPYSFSFSFQVTDPKGESVIVEFDSTAHISPALQNKGFTIESRANGFVLGGKPTVDFEGDLYFIFRNHSGSDYHFARPFLINPDPRSLWGDHPVEDYEGYKNDDNTAQGVLVPGLPLEVIAASARGRSHSLVGKPRDDCFSMFFDESTGWNYVAVADGAGSAKYSRKGSELACETVIESLRSSLEPEATAAILKQQVLLERWKTEFIRHTDNADRGWENEFVDMTRLDAVFHTAVYAAYMAIHDESKRREASIKDYHTTLLCAAFRYIKEIESYFIASYWVGDGGAALMTPNLPGAEISTKVFVLGEPDGGEFAGQTRFLTMPSEIDGDAIRRRLRFSFCEKIEAMLLVTDGITDPFFPSEAAVGDAKRWDEFYNVKLKSGCEEEPGGCPILGSAAASPQEKADSLLRWLGFWSKGNHDDRTVLIVKPRNNS